ncbi:lactate racemase domain-containing protein [Pontiella agarivorans]|uniref:Lactate racemase domain-containing protein n=1 Tax=Pontiella agarivorans TaxID=3038953 RepID=A0ABU5MUT0_9BACT|nr:lactate racemase domain-containing protein [Pontiella agarivorans]MDZ8117948.1 lactate racemase domain-containing protein [Pontiella agarivorans]
MISTYGEDISISQDELRDLVFQTLEASGTAHLRRCAEPRSSAGRRVLLLPPDHTRLNSMAGPITAMVYEKLTADGVEVDILPTLGTHNPMTDAQLRMMFGEQIPLDAFKVHDWRNEVVRKGEISGDMLAELSDGKVNYTVGVEVNRMLFDGYDLILSIGQVVPHEVVGMANYTKNIVVGAGGSDIINKSHFLGAVAGIENILGQTDSPVRRLFNHAVATYLADLPITYILTVMEQDYDSGEMHMRGFFAGEDVTVFEEACKLARAVNITLLDREPKKVVVYLDPHEFQSTWLGNKSVYRTRMAIADDGELIVLAPALKEFGEDPTIDKLIRKFGYCGTPATLKHVEEDEELRSNLGAAAHLIHGSSEGRFAITYCPGREVTLDEVRSVGFKAAAYDEMAARYDPAVLKDGWNILPDGEEIFYISNPALGLWAFKDKFKE